MRSKEALENIKREAGTPYYSTLYDIDDWREDFKIIEKDLDRLEKLEMENKNFRKVLKNIYDICTFKDGKYYEDSLEQIFDIREILEKELKN